MLRIWVFLALLVTPAWAQLSTKSVQMFGSVSSTDNAIRVPVDPPQAADVGVGAFTLEQWLRCTDAANDPNVIGGSYRGSDTETSQFDWIWGLIFLDRDIDGYPPSGGGDWGASIHRPSASSTVSVVRWGAENNATSLTVQGSMDVCNDTWHHVAVGRDDTGHLFIVVDGVLDYRSTATILGSLAYPNGTGRAADPFLVWGTEKHAYQRGFVGYLDELRVWSVARSAADIATNRWLTVNAATPGLALYLRLEEGLVGNGSNPDPLTDYTGLNTGLLLYRGVAGDGAWSSSVPTPSGSTTTSTTPTSSTSSTSTSSTTSTTVAMCLCPCA